MSSSTGKSFERKGFFDIGVALESLGVIAMAVVCSGYPLVIGDGGQIFKELVPEIRSSWRC
jgi:hypothetical protein